MAEYAGKTVVFKHEDEVNEAIRQYEEETVTHFVVYAVMKSFSSSELKVNRFRWYANAQDSVSIQYDRTPFCFVGKKTLCCHMGEDRSKGQKSRYKAKKEKEKAAGLKRRRRVVVKTKKKDCKAVISIKKIVKFPEFQLEEGKELSNYYKKVTNKKLMDELNNNSEAVVKEVQFYVKFAAIEDHTGHVMGEDAGRVEPVDKRIQAHLQELADTGITSYASLQTLVCKYVEKELFANRPVPPRTRRRFYPTLKDIQNFMTRWKAKHPAIVQQSISLLPSLGDIDVTNDINRKKGYSMSIDVQPPRDEGEGLITLMNMAVQEVVTTTCTQVESGGDVVTFETDCDIIPTVQHTTSSQEIQQELEEPEVADNSKGQRKIRRIGLVCKMKDLSHQLLDFCLLVKNQFVLREFVGDLQRMVTKASEYATLDPTVVQNELVRNRRKRQGGPPVFHQSNGNKVARLSDII